MGIEVFEKMGIEVQKVGIANLRTTCIAHSFICRKRKPSAAGKEEKKARVKGSIKYNAAKLYEKGVVLEIENLSHDQ